MSTNIATPGSQPTKPNGNGASKPSAIELELAKLRAENEALRKAQVRTGPMTMKISEKGALSVYGNGKFPTTLYKEQWERLAAFMPNIVEFIKANSAKLKTKADSVIDKANGGTDETKDPGVKAFLAQMEESYGRPLTLPERMETIKLYNETYKGK